MLKSPEASPGLLLRETLDFTAAGKPRATEGLCAPELHHSWALAPISRVTVPPCPGAQTLYLLIEITPFHGAGGWPALELSICADDEPCTTLRAERSTVVAVRIAAPDRIANGFVLSFACPDAPRPGPGQPEQRHLAFALHRIRVFEPAAPIGPGSRRLSAYFVETPPALLFDAIRQKLGFSAGELLIQFENLGNNCDFGCAQKQCGIDPLGLLRYAAADPHDLARAILLDFRGIGEDLKIYSSPDPPEYMITDMRYTIHSHTNVVPGTADTAVILRKAGVRLELLERKFKEDIRNGNKLFLLRQGAPDTSNGWLTLWVVLNLYARNTVLCVTQDPDWRPRGVEEIEPGLLSGTVDGGLGGRAPSLAAWLYLCGDAYLLANTK